MARARQKRAPRADASNDTAAREAAISDILQVMVRSPGALQPVFDTILEHTLALCSGHVAALWRYDGARLRYAASRNSPPEAVAYMGQHPLELGDWNPTPQAALERKPLNVLDVFANPDYRPLIPPGTSGKRPNAGTVLAVPLVRGDELFGVITIWRYAQRLFSEREVELMKTFTAQAVIAIQNVRQFHETRDALEQQTAMAEILKLIAASPSDTQPVFDAIARSAQKLRDAHYANVSQRVGDELHLAAATGSESSVAWLRELFPAKVTGQGALGKAVLSREPNWIADVETDPAYSPAFREGARERGYRSLLAVPMLREKVSIGAIAVTRRDPGPFTDHQIGVLKTFADQAVIAIENVRLFNETKAALEQQTATAQILRVISSSPNDIQPVFESIVEHAMRLCDAGLGTAGLYDGKTYQHVAQRGGSPEYREWLFKESFEPGPGSTLGLMIAEQRPVHIADYRELASYREGNPRSVATVELGGARTYLAVPMLKDGQVIGGITIRRAQVRPFTQTQIDLVTTFASQAVIAIENVRLFNETKESLEQQTATAEILKVISGSPTDVRPVFDAILKSAVALCDAELAATFPFDGKLVHLGATHNWSREALAYFSKVYPSPPSPQLLSGRTILGKQIVEISDAATDAHYDPNSVITGHWRRMLGVPMLREGEPLGALVAAWREPGETPRRQVELLQTFADQAAIAIENVRLFNETKEALEQQTATADILRVITSSPASVQPVFDAILEEATDLCEAQLGALFLAGPEVWRMVSHRGASPEAQEAYREFRVGPNTGLGRMTRDRRPVHIEDLLADTATSQRDPLRVATIEKLGARTFLAVPLLKDGVVIGGVVIYRREVRPFGEAQIRLLSTFADQAVIAIENVRLFNETKEALEQQTAISEVLRVISNSPADVQPVLDAVAERAARICEAIDAQVFLREGDHMKHVARFGPMAIGVDIGDTRPLTRDWVAGQAVLE